MSIKNIKNPLLRNRIQKLTEIDQSIIDNSHTHSNKSTLDNVTQSVIDNSHTHSNKSTLDNVTQSVIDESHVQNTDYKIEKKIQSTVISQSNKNALNERVFLNKLTITEDVFIEGIWLWFRNDPLNMYNDIVIDIFVDTLEPMKILGIANSNFINYTSPYFRTQITPILNEKTQYSINKNFPIGDYFIAVYRADKTFAQSKADISLELLSDSFDGLICNVFNGNLIVANTIPLKSILWGITGLKTSSKVECKNGEVEFSGDLIINGDIKQNGAIYETHAEQIYTEKDTIIMREGAISALGSNEKSGFKILKYNNIDNSIFGVGNDGYARVGDEGGTLQRIATIEENATDTKFVYYDAPTKSLKTGDVGGGGRTLVAEYTINSNTQSFNITVSIPQGKKIEMEYYMDVVDATNNSITEEINLRINNLTSNIYQINGSFQSMYYIGIGKTDGYIDFLFNGNRLIGNAKTFNYYNSAWLFTQYLYRLSLTGSISLFTFFNRNNQWLKSGGWVKIYVL